MCCFFHIFTEILFFVCVGDVKITQKEQKEVIIIKVINETGVVLAFECLYQAVLYLCILNEMRRK